MITGVVTTSRQAVIRLTVRGPEGQEQEIETVIDTGFDGSLTLPPTLIVALGLVWRRRGRAISTWCRGFRVQLAADPQGSSQSGTHSLH
jgi:predicted aspartyl protease